MNSLPLKYQSDIVLTFYFQSYFYHYYLNDIQTSLFIFIPYYFSSTYINQYMSNCICCSGSECIHLQIWSFSSKLKTDIRKQIFFLSLLLIYTNKFSCLRIQHFQKRKLIFLGFLIGFNLMTHFESSSFFLRVIQVRK